MISIFALIAEIVFLFGFRLLGYAGDSDALSFVFVLFFSLIYLVELQKQYGHRVEKNALALGYFLRIVTLLFDLYGRSIYHLPNSGADSEGFFRHTVYNAKYAVPFSESGGFPGFMALFAKMVGTSRLFLQFIVMLFSVVTLHTAAQIMLELKIEDRARKKATLMIALLPNFAILSSIFLRESIVTMLISRGILHLVRWMKHRSTMELIISAACIVASSYFHGGSIAILAGYVVLLLLYDREKEQMRLTLRSIFLSLVALSVLVFLYTRYGDTLFTKVANVEELEDIANTSQMGGSSYGAYAGNSSSIGSMIIFTPIRILLFLYSPFFWQIRGLSDIIAFCFDSLFYIVVTLRFRKALRRADKNRKADLLCFMIVAFATAFVFGWGVSNVGTAIRHRDKLIVVWVVMYGLEEEIFMLGKQQHKPNGQQFK